MLARKKTSVRNFDFAGLLVWHWRLNWLCINDNVMISPKRSLNWSLNRIRIKMKSVFVAIVCLLWGFSYGQNVVSNPGFESFSSAPTSYGQITNASPWYSANGSADLFHPSASSGTVGVPTNYFGTQTAHGGIMYSGIAASSSNIYHEYIGTALSSALTVGQSYYVEVFVSAGEGSYRMATNNFGFYFTNGVVMGGAGDPPISATPQVNYTTVISNSAGWTQVSGTFTASSAFTHLTLGNFFSSAATSWVNIPASGSISSQYWYIDDVVVQPAVILAMPPHTFAAKAVSNKTVGVDWEFSDMTGIKEFVVRRSADDGATWEEFARIPASANVKAYATTDQPNVWGHELQYSLRSISNDGAVSVSEIVRLTLDVPALDESLTLSPNPMRVGDVCEVHLALKGAGNVEWNLFDLSGRRVGHGEASMAVGTGSFPLETAGFAPGTYLLKVTVGNDVATRKLVVM
jgi:hypothetical protein